MVLLIIIPFLNGYFIGNINPTFSDKPIFDHPFIAYWGSSYSEPATSAPPVARTGRVVPGVQYQEQVKSIG